MRRKCATSSAARPNARDFAARRNHDLLAQGGSSSAPLSAITAPTLVIHGTADPMFPVEHGQALAREIPDARLVRLDGAGHGIDPADRDTIAAAIIDHTARHAQRAQLHERPAPRG